MSAPTTETGRALLAAIDALDYDAYDAPRYGNVANQEWDGALIAIEDEARAPLAAAIRLMVVRHHEGVYDYATCDVCSAAVAALAP